MGHRSTRCFCDALVGRGVTSVDLRITTLNLVGEDWNDEEDCCDWMWRIRQINTFTQVI